MVQNTKYKLWALIVVETLKTKGRQLDNPAVTGGTSSCHNDNPKCHQWRQSCQIDDRLPPEKQLAGSSMCNKLNKCFEESGYRDSLGPAKIELRIHCTNYTPKYMSDLSLTFFILACLGSLAPDILLKNHYDIHDLNKVTELGTANLKGCLMFMITVLLPLHERVWYFSGSGHPRGRPLWGSQDPSQTLH